MLRCAILFLKPYTQLISQSTSSEPSPPRQPQRAPPPRPPQLNDALPHPGATTAAVRRLTEEYTRTAGWWSEVSRSPGQISPRPPSLAGTRTHGGKGCPDTDQVRVCHLYSFSFGFRSGYCTNMMAHSSRTRIGGKVDGQFFACSLVAVETYSSCVPPTAFLDRRRFGMRVVGMLLVLSASRVFFLSGFMPLWFELTTGFSH